MYNEFLLSKYIYYFQAIFTYSKRFELEQEVRQEDPALPSVPNLRLSDVWSVRTRRRRLLLRLTFNWLPVDPFSSLVHGGDHDRDLSEFRSEGLQCPDLIRFPLRLEQKRDSEPSHVDHSPAVNMARRWVDEGSLNRPARVAKMRCRVIILQRLERRWQLGTNGWCGSGRGGA